MSDEREGARRRAGKERDAGAHAPSAPAHGDDKMPPPGAWRRESSEPLADCRVFRVRRDVSLSPRDGRAHDFYVIDAPDWINVIPLTAEGEVVLIEQYRHGIEEVTLEIPGGMVDEGESPRAAAARELFEETGYEAREVFELGRTRPNPAIQNNWIHTFLARDVVFRREPEFDGTEHTVARRVPLGRVPDLIAEGKITHSLVVVAFHWLDLRGTDFTLTR